MKKIMGVLIILFVVFISLLIILLPTFFSQDKTRTKVNKKIVLEHILDGSKNIEFVFFGYVGCRDVCTPRLESLANWYNNLSNDLQNKIDVKFINLSQLKDANLANNFAKAFNEKFIGIYLKPNKLREYTKSFTVYFSKSLSDDYEMDHTAHLYLLKKENGIKSIKYIYSRYPYNFESIEQDLKGLMNE